MKTVLVFLLLIASKFSFTQSYIDLPDSNAKWINVHKTFTGNPANVPTWQIQYCADGFDTVINGNVFSKIDTCGGGYKGAIRNNLGKVLFVPKDSIVEYLLYDFTVIEGDTVKNVYIESFSTTDLLHDLYISPGAIDSVLLNGLYRKRIAFDQSWSYWIEGIGNTQGLFWEPWPNISAYQTELFCMSDKGFTIYPDTGFGSCENFTGLKDEEYNTGLSIFPVPSSSYLTIELNLNFNELAVINMKGDEVFNVGNLSTTSYLIDIASYSSGIYLIIIRVNNKIITRKFLKE